MFQNFSFRIVENTQIKNNVQFCEDYLLDNLTKYWSEDISLTYKISYQN